MNERIDHFSFWKPVAFSLTDNPGTTDSAKWGWVIGSLADQYASLSQETLHVNAERINARKIYFESNEVENVSLLLTIAKIASYILTLGIPLVLALTIKMIFKNHLNSCKALTKQSPNEIFAAKQIGKTKISLYYGSITNETTDVITNAANAHLWAGSGVCGAIHADAGDVPFDECKEILKNQNRRHLKCGEAVLTSAGELAARIQAIAHTVGPDYRIRKEKENGSDLLAAAYQSPLDLIVNPQGREDFISSSVKEQKPSLHSIAYPSISTGIFGAPLEESAQIAFKTIKGFIEKHPDALEEVRFVFLPLDKDAKTAPAYQAALDSL